MAKLKLCPYCGGKHRKLSQVKKCRDRLEPQEWAKLPKIKKKR